MHVNELSLPSSGGAWWTAALVAIPLGALGPGCGDSAGTDASPPTTGGSAGAGAAAGSGGSGQAGSGGTGGSSSTSPAISDIAGSIVDGETVVITGTGFGSHADHDVMGTDYLCSWWDDFDSYDDLPALDAQWNWSDANFTLDTTEEYRGRQSIKFTPDTSSSKLRQGVDPYDAGGVWYTSFWYYLSPEYYLDGAQQWKLVRMYGATPNPDYYPGIVPSGNGTLGHHSDDDCSDCYSVTASFFTVDSTVQGMMHRGNWHRMEVLVDSESDELLYYVDGHLWYDCNDRYGSSCIPDDFDASVFRQASFDAVRHPDPTNYGHLDDVFINNTWARVEISQTSTLFGDSNTIITRNIQLPRTWSDTEITVDLNLEGLSGTVYVFVINGTGTASNGYEVTL